MMSSPHEVGEEALAERISLSEEKRGGPWITWLLLLLLLFMVLVVGLVV